MVVGRWVRRRGRLPPAVAARRRIFVGGARVRRRVRLAPAVTAP